MKKMITLLFLSFMASSMLCAQISQSDYDALKALYESTNGKSWTNNSGWDFSQPASEVKAWNKNAQTGWFGISEIKKNQVSKLELSENNLVGTLPDAICNLTMLRSLNLEKNQISGELPTEIGNLVKISTLKLAENKLTGNLPASFVHIGKEAAIQPLDEAKNKGTDVVVSLKNNKFSGVLPSNIGSMELFKKSARTSRLDLSNNQLTGEIPSSITELVELTELVLDNNQLGGKVPMGIESMPKLKKLKLEKNKFEGKVPKGKK